MAKRSKIGRWDPDVLAKCKKIMPNESEPGISRILFNTSLVRVENALRRNSPKDIEELLYGNHIKNSKKKRKQ